MFAAVSSSRQIYSAPPHIFPAHTLVATVSRGRLVSLVFEQGCDLCSASDCNYDVQPSGAACAVAETSCAPPAAPSGCDLSIVFVFQGTDAAGLALQSAARRPSIYSRFSVEGVGEALRRLVVRE
jgi:hypothetical protein